MENEEREVEYKAKDAAKYVGKSLVTLQKSRTTGMLSGKPAPKFVKRGQIYYKKSELDNWLASFEEYE